jgi:hypothetical protein
MAKSKHLLQKKKKEDPFNTIQIQEDKELAALPFCKVLPLTSLFHLSLCPFLTLDLYKNRKKKKRRSSFSFLAVCFFSTTTFRVRASVGGMNRIGALESATR